MKQRRVSQDYLVLMEIVLKENLTSSSDRLLSCIVVCLKKAISFIIKKSKKNEGEKFQ